MGPSEHECACFACDERYANHRCFMQIVKAFAGRGVSTFIYASDALGLMHRLDASTAGAICGAALPGEAKIQFYEHATCVRCVSAT